MLEVERLWPPFFGGIRVCNEVSIRCTHTQKKQSAPHACMYVCLLFAMQSCEVAGFRFEEGTNTSYISYWANRDGRVFPNPDAFRPDRWKNE